MAETARPKPDGMCECGHWAEKHEQIIKDGAYGCWSMRRMPDGSPADAPEVYCACISFRLKDGTS